MIYSGLTCSLEKHCSLTIIVVQSRGEVKFEFVASSSSPVTSQDLSVYLFMLVKKLICICHSSFYICKSSPFLFGKHTGNMLAAVQIFFGCWPEYLLLNYPSSPSPSWIIFMTIMPGPHHVLFLLPTHVALPLLLWQMELSKEVKDDAVQLCGSGE